MSPTLSFFRMMLGPLAPSLHPNRLSLWSAISHLFVNNKKNFSKIKFKNANFKKQEWLLPWNAGTWMAMDLQFQRQIKQKISGLMHKPWNTRHTGKVQDIPTCSWHYFSVVYQVMVKSKKLLHFSRQFFLVCMVDTHFLSTWGSPLQL